MSEVNRREFMALSGLAAGGAALAGCGTQGGSGGQAGAGDARHADQVVTNATVYTVDDANPRAEALAVKSGRFLAVGSNARYREPRRIRARSASTRAAAQSSPGSSTRTTTPPRPACATSPRWT